MSNVQNVLVSIPRDLLPALDKACEFTGLSREELILRGAMAEVVYQNSRPPSDRPYYCRPPDPADAEGAFAGLAEQWTSRHGRPSTHPVSPRHAPLVIPHPTTPTLTQ